MIIEEFTYFLSLEMIQRKEHPVYMPITPATLRRDPVMCFKSILLFQQKKKNDKNQFCGLIEVPKINLFLVMEHFIVVFLIT